LQSRYATKLTLHWPASLAESGDTVSDRVVIACKDGNFEECLKLALAHGTGLELQGFAEPDTLDGDWRAVVARYKKHFAKTKFGGLLSVHGAFFDLVSASPDSKVVALARERYTTSLEIAHEFGAKFLVFHANFIAMIRMPAYREQWTSRQIDFWGGMVKEAERLGVTLLLENMWEPDPAIIADVLDGVNSPHLRACIDVGHAHLFSELVLDNWIERTGRHLVYAHLNNNPGSVDYHLALSEGAIDYSKVLSKLRALPEPPVFCLEIERVDDIVRSLPYFELPRLEKA
jgi:sugar phosphate isomerase/epimerase